MFIEIITKFTGSLFYGFTADMLQSFSDKSLLGFGVLGSEYYKTNDSKIKVIASNEKDQMLENNGFVNTYIGKDKTGLAKLWRGTRIIKKDGKIFKTVPFYLKRPKVIRHAIISDIKKITFNDLFFEIILGDGRTIFSNELVFACGPLENTRLLSSIIDYKEPCYLSDHEIFNLGVVSKLVPIRSGFIKKFGPFAIRRNLLEVNNIKQKTVVEFKPFSEEHFKGEGNKIYFDTTPNIILKLLRSFSLSRINEAFFTKFGFGFLTNKFIIFCQTLNKDCIKYDPIKGSFTKQRLNEADFHQISNEIEAKIGKFKKIFPTETIDGQHAMGASSIFKNQYLQDLIKEKKITILGSPTSLQLDHLHHTSIFIDKIKGKKL